MQTKIENRKMEVADVAVGLRAPAPSHQQLKKGSCVSEGDYVAILVNEGKKWMLARALKNEKVKLSKTVTISGDLLIGKSFGCFFEVDQRSKDLKPIFPSSRSELLMSDLDDINAVDGNDQIVSVTGEHNQLGQESRNPLQDTATTEPLVNFQKLVDTLGSNKDLISCSEAQKLSSEEIERMKVESSGKDIISQLTKNLETFKQKTIFSQLKYVNKKKKKYLLQFQLLRPTASVIAETCLSRGGLKVLWLRSDSLAQLLSQADIRSQGKYLLFDQSNGLLTGAVLERMVGLLPHSLPPPSLVEECGEQSESHTFGSVINLFSETFVPSPFSLKCFNFPTWLTDSMLTFFPLQLLQPLLISPPILPVSQFCFTASSSPSSSTSPPSEKELETEIDCPLSTEFSSPFKSDKSLPLSLQTKVRSVLSEGADA